MPAFLGGKAHRLRNLSAAYGLSAFPKPQVNPEQLLLDRGDLRGSVPYRLSVVPDVFHVCIHGSQPAHAPKGVAEVEIAITIAVVCPINE